MTENITIREFFIKIGEKTFKLFFSMIKEYHSLIFFRNRKIHLILQYKPKLQLPGIYFHYHENSKIFMIKFSLFFSFGIFIEYKTHPRIFTTITCQNLLLLAIIIILGRIIYINTR
jgi:hypothetical protein